MAPSAFKVTADLDGLTPIKVDLPSADVPVYPIESHDCPTPDPDCFDGGDAEEVTMIFSTKSTAASSFQS